MISPSSRSSPFNGMQRRFLDAVALIDSATLTAPLLRAVNASAASTPSRHDDEDEDEETCLGEDEDEQACLGEDEDAQAC